MPLIAELLRTLVETTRDVLPIVAILTVFQLFVLRQELPNPLRLLQGIAFVMAGLVLFLLGLEHALFPIGKSMAAQLTAATVLGPEGAAGSPAHDPMAYVWVYVFAFAIGFSTTIAEPALIAVSLKAEELSGGSIRARGLRIAVAIGVAIGITLGVFRIVIGAPLHYFIGVGYILVVAQTLVAPRLIVPLAYDSGGVTTSTMTVPLVAALGLGLAASLPGRSPLIDGFGLIAFASLFPMIAVMTYAQVSEWWAAHSREQVARTADRLASEED
jgi:hypothetical protein